MAPAASQRGQRPLEVRPLLVGGEARGGAVGMRVVADLVPGGQNRLDGLRVAVGGQAGDEERGFEPVLGQQGEQARDPDAGTECLVGHGHRVVGVAPALGEDRGLGVDVERQHRDRGMSGSPIRHGVPANQRGAVGDNCSLHQPDRLSLGRCPNGGCRLNRTLGAPPARVWLSCV